MKKNTLLKNLIVDSVLDPDPDCGLWSGQLEKSPSGSKFGYIEITILIQRPKNHNQDPQQCEVNFTCKWFFGHRRESKHKGN